MSAGDRGRCKCGGCGRVFSGLTTFDMHQRATDAAPWVECVDPALVVDKHGNGRMRLINDVWRSAVDNPRWSR